MERIAHGTASFGDVVVAAFDGAARYSSDPEAVSSLATQAVAILLRRSRGLDRTPRGRPPTVAGTLLMVVPA